MPTYNNNVVDALTIGDDAHVRWVLAQVYDPATVISDSVMIQVVSKEAIDALTIGDAVSISIAERPSDALTIGDAAKISNQVDRLTDGLTVAEELMLVDVARVTDALTIADAVDLSIVAGLSDTLTIGEELSVAQTLVNKVADAIVVKDAERDNGNLALLLDPLTVGDQLQVARFTKTLVVDALTSGDDSSAPSSVDERLVDALTIGDAVTTLMATVQLVADSYDITDAVTGGGTGAWRAHAEPMAMTRYTNFPFNSMAVIDGLPMGANAGGIFILGGDTDDGVGIDTTIQHDISDDTLDDQGKMQNDPHFKRPRWMYASYQSDGVLRMNLGYVDQDGNEHTASFDMPAQTANQFVTGRIQLGRGIRSRYLRPTIVNVDGAAWQMNEAKLIVDSIRRKV